MSAKARITTGTITAIRAIFAENLNYINLDIHHPEDWPSGYEIWGRIRASGGPTQLEIAAQLGISQTIVSDWTTGHRKDKSERERKKRNDARGAGKQPHI